MCSFGAGIFHFVASKLLLVDWFDATSKSNFCCNSLNFAFIWFWCLSVPMCCSNAANPLLWTWTRQQTSTSLWREKIFLGPIFLPSNSTDRFSHSWMNLVPLALLKDDWIQSYDISRNCLQFETLLIYLFFEASKKSMNNKPSKIILCWVSKKANQYIHRLSIVSTKYPCRKIMTWK